MSDMDGVTGRLRHGDSEVFTGQPAWPAQQIIGSVSDLVSRKMWMTQGGRGGDGEY